MVFLYFKNRRVSSERKIDTSNCPYQNDRQTVQSFPWNFKRIAFFFKTDKQTVAKQMQIFLNG